MGFLKLISTLCSAVQPPSQPTCMYPEQWSDSAAIMVNGVPRYPGSYAAQLVRSQPANRLGAFLDCFHTASRSRVPLRGRRALALSPALERIGGFRVKSVKAGESASALL